MREVKVVGGRKTQLLDYLGNRRRYWELKEETEDRKIWKREEEIQIIFHKSIDLLISSIVNNKFTPADLYLF